MKIWKITDTGLVRKDNQDSYGVIEQAAGGYTICVVCDGMGGAAAGALASSIAVETFLQSVQSVLTADASTEQIQEMASYSVTLANKAIREYASRHEDCLGMGTTLVSAIAKDGNVIVSNVGDSRAYHIFNEDIVKITKDHSLVERMVERGDITEEEARRHPKRNLITRALGPDSSIICDSYITALKPGEYILLCTDGLVDTVTDQEILFELVHSGPMETCLQRLLTIAKANGAPDNITAVLLYEEKGGA
ncbi:MAG: Stp1/IreP family PP2C-type Ser/Thr phosphatase [Ruminococcaceae bacterium]|nr:Stp1/IreP family PP2C-type Ser/Thr phosphatase [Oscillospiraceae bacterium]